MAISGLAHCCYHDRHWEWCNDFYERVEYIKKHKPKEEIPLRLKLLFLVPDDLLPGKGSKELAAYEKAGVTYDKAWSAYNKAWSAYDEAWSAYNKAWSAYDEAWSAYIAKYGKDIDALHDELCPNCPWDGKTIFSGKEVK